MREPLWLSKNLVFALHERLIAEFGGAVGLRDEGLLESALGRPRSLFLYGTPGICDLAAAYAFGIVRNHPFLDGNKRTGFTAAAVFLETNGFLLTASEVDAIGVTLALADGSLGEERYASFLKENTNAISSARKKNRR